MAAFGFDKRAGEIGQRLKRRFIGCRREPARECRRPAAQVFAEKFLLRIAALGELISVELMFERVRFLRSENAHEFQFQTNVIVALTGVFSDFESECAVECSEVGEAMRLEEWVGFDVAIFDLVQRAAAARRMAEGGDVGVAKSRSGVSAGPPR